MAAILQRAVPRPWGGGAAGRFAGTEGGPAPNPAAFAGGSKSRL